MNDPALNPAEWDLTAWANSSAGRIVLLSVITFGVFFIAEHRFEMATLENFVLDIEEQEGFASGGNTLRRAAFLGCAACGLLGLAFGPKKRFRWTVPVGLLLFYLLWGGASVVWSIDSGTTMRRYFVLGCCVVGCFGVARLLSIEEVIFAAVVTNLCFLCVGVGNEIVCGVFTPHVGDYRFAGTLHPNTQAANMVILCLASFTMAKLKPKWSMVFYGIMLVGMLFLVLTKCRSATGALPLSIMVAWLVSQSKQTIAVGILACTWVFGVAALCFVVSGFDPVSEYSNVLLLGRAEETGSSLTGRIPLWIDLGEYIRYRPIQGYGFDAFWTPRHIYEIALGQEWTISEAHSSYVEVALHLGFVGVFLMVVTGISSFFYSVTMFRRTQQAGFLFLVGGIFFALLRSLTETGLGGPAGFTCFLFLAMASHSWRTPAEPGAVEVTTSSLLPDN